MLHLELSVRRCPLPFASSDGLLPPSVLLSFVAPRSRHFAPTTLIESSLRARLITPLLLPLNVPSPCGYVQVSFSLSAAIISRRSHLLRTSMIGGSSCLASYARRTLVVRSSYARRFCSSLLCLGLTHIHQVPGVLVLAPFLQDLAFHLPVTPRHISARNTTLAPYRAPPEAFLPTSAVWRSIYFPPPPGASCSG